MVAIPKSKTDREDEARVERINHLVSPLLTRLGILQQYNLVTTFADKLEPMGKFIPGTGDRACSAICMDGYPYREITIQIERSHFDHMTDNAVVDLMTHEVLHPIIFGDIGRVAADQGMTTGKRNKQVWCSLEENAVDLLALWIAGFWNEIRAAEEKKRKRTPKQDA